MKSKTKHTIAKVVIFLANFAFGALFIGLGWFASTYASVSGGSGSSLPQLMIPVGILIIVLSIWVLFSTNIKVYITLAAVTLISILAWMVLVSPYDMVWGLIVYLLLMVPVLVLKCKS